MKIRITTSHITSEGAVAPGTIIDVDIDTAVDYMAAKLAVVHKEAYPEKATSKKTKETATTR